MRILMCAAGVWAVLAVPTWASDLRVIPTRVVIDPAEKGDSITVRNEDTKTAAIQVEVAAWTQVDAQDTYTPTREILASPALFEIKPGAEQVVRMLLQAGEATNERAYRIFLQEVPLKDAPPSTDALLRIGIPVFVSPLKSHQALQWTLDVTRAGKLDVHVVNAGTVHAQITGFRILNDKGDVVAHEDIFAYALPGQSRRWQVDAKEALAHAEKVHVEARTDTQVMREAVQIGVHGHATAPTKR